jgi:SMC interacting uncharacterized protein involved in chromosome segregation|tara:strand:+ start:505 stop:711 length:207 start_codon:yes stop_codon:yes gene_type:complete
MNDELNRMQLQLDKHTGQISKLFSKIDDTNLCIQKINNSLLQIKYGVYGALGWYVITNIGIIEAMRLM